MYTQYIRLVSCTSASTAATTIDGHQCIFGSKVDTMHNKMQEEEHWIYIP